MARWHAALHPPWDRTGAGPTAGGRPCDVPNATQTQQALLQSVPLRPTKQSPLKDEQMCSDVDRGQTPEDEDEAEDKISASRTVWPRGLNITADVTFLQLNCAQLFTGDALRKNEKRRRRAKIDKSSEADRIQTRTCEVQCQLARSH